MRSDKRGVDIGKSATTFAASVFYLLLKRCGRGTDDVPGSPFPALYLVTRTGNVGFSSWMLWDANL